MASASAAPDSHEEPAQAQILTGPPLKWHYLDPVRGVFVCERVDRAYDSFKAVAIGDFHIARVLRDRDGRLVCASKDALVADTVRVGRQCDTCEDAPGRCGRRWLLTWQDPDTTEIFAHRLSLMGTVNFSRYLASLESAGGSALRVFTSIAIERAWSLAIESEYCRVCFRQCNDPTPWHRERKEETEIWL